MKLDYIYLDSYKNLKDFEVTFNEGVFGQCTDRQ